MSSKEPQRSAPKRILIVEDNELNMKLLNDVLEAYGYDVIKTASGAAVLELARQHGPDLILIDIQLPDISGLEAVRQLKGDAQTKAIPVIAVTALRWPATSAARSTAVATAISPNRLCCASFS
jgi:two-component system cell cycle response regulator DivK